MAHIQACTACGKKVACLACSRKAPSLRPAKRQAAPVRRRTPAPVCGICGFGYNSCDCGGFEDGDVVGEEEEILDDDEEEPDGFGGGCGCGAATSFDSLAAAFLSDDDEDPLADDEGEEDSVDTWKPPRTPRRTSQAPQSRAYTFVDAPTTGRVARNKKISGYAASSISKTRQPYDEFRRLAPATQPILNTSETMAGIVSGAIAGMRFYDWARSIGTVTQRWNNPVTYIPGRSIHGGTDIAALPIGAPITAYRGGRVIEVKGNSTLTTGWGLTIVLKDDQGRTHRYAHLLEELVTMGENVQAGELIGRMGKSGNVFGKTGIHLHYEIKDKFGNLLDPETV